MIESGGVTFDLPVLTLKVIAESEDDQNLALTYWDHSVNENGKLAWTETVGVVVARDGRYEGKTQRQVTLTLLADVGASCVATAKFVTCDRCGANEVLTSRSKVPVLDTASRWLFTCPVCLPLKAAEEAAVKVAAMEAAAVARGIAQSQLQNKLNGQIAWIAAHHPLLPDEDSPDLERCGTFTSHVVLDALLVDLPASGVIPATAEAVPSTFDAMGATGEWIHDRLVELQADGVIAVHPQAVLSAFQFKATEDAQVVMVGWYPSKVTWQCRGRGSVAARAASVRSSLRSALAGTWLTEWADEAVSLAQVTVAREAARYYAYMVALHHLPPLKDGDQQARLEALLSEHAAQFSLGQLHSAIWGVTQSGAAATQRHELMPRQNATTSTLNSLERYLSKSVAQSWDLKHFTRESEVPLTAVTEALFRVLGLDPMTATPAKVLAAAQSHLDRDDVLTGSIVRGVTDEEYARVMATLEDLATTLRGVTDAHEDRFGANALTASRVLAKIKLIVLSARLQGCCDADALKAAYFGLGYIASFDPDNFWVGLEIQGFIRSALDQTLDVSSVLEDMTRDDWPARFPTNSQPALTLVR